MSWVLQALVAERVCGSITRKMILLNMAARANDDGSGIYAAIPTIAGWCEIDARSVRRVCRELEADGLITVASQRKIRNGWVNDWQINIEAVRSLASVKDELQIQRENKAKKVHRTQCPPQDVETPDTVSARTVRPATPDTVSAKSIQETNNPPSEEPTVLPQTPKRGSRLPDDWALTPKLTAYAVEHGYSEHEAAFIADRFKNHWLASSLPSARKLDWNRAFQNWVTGEKRWAVQQGAAAWRRTQAEPAMTPMERAAFKAKWLAAGKEWPAHWDDAA